MPRSYTGNLIPQITPLTSSSVADGDQDFKLIGGDTPNITNIFNSMFFVDGTGAKVSATGGNVTITGSPDGGITFLTLDDNEFSAADADKADRIRPSGIGKLTLIRVNLSGVTGAVGFRGEFVQAIGI